MLLLRRKVLPLLRAASELHSPVHHRACPLLSTSSSASASASRFSLEDYLVSACGLAPAEAHKAAQKALGQASKRCNEKASEELSCSRLNSASNPDAILDLLYGVGLSRADIAAVIAADPLLLRSSVKNVGPRLRTLHHSLDLSAPQIVRFLLVGSRALRGCDVAPKVQFFIFFFGSFDKLISTMKKSNGFMLSDFDRVIHTNIKLFRLCGLSDEDIAHMCSKNPWLISNSPAHTKALVLRAEELGVPRSSRMFKSSVLVASHISKEKVAARFEFLENTLGCSKSEVATAVSKMPNILELSEEHLLRKIQYLINEVGMEPQYIIERPNLLAFSLEKRLVPRHRVTKLLQAKGLFNSNLSLLSLATMGEKTFRLKFIDCHKDSVPELAGYYATSCAGEVSPKVQLSS